MVKVTIIIPMYNVSGYLDTCINSVLDQKMDAEHLEVIMIDDGSPDDSWQRAMKIAEDLEFVKVISQKNKGLGGARNTGIQNATGKYLIFLDADDILIPNTLSKLVSIAEENELEILEFSIQKSEEDGEVIEEIIHSSKGEVYTGIEYYNKYSYMSSACNKLYSRKFLNDHNLLFVEKIYAEDFEFNTRAFYYLKRIMAIDLVAASFLQSSDSITRNRDRTKQDKYVNDLESIIRRVQAFKKDLKRDLTSEELDYFDLKMTNQNVGIFYFMFKNGYSYTEMMNCKNTLKKEGLFQVSSSVNNKKKDLFRKIVLRNFFFFSFLNSLRGFIKIS